MNETFYYKFEKKFRGSRELIRSRLAIYNDYIEFIVKNFENLDSVDLGCGRGEFLEILTNKGFNAVGVDTNKNFNEDCLKYDLNIVNSDALNYLKKLPSNSIALISSFHFIEHVKFEYLYDLIKEIRRVLLPGGLIILETPNPENMVVSSKTFYYDPTHLKPIPFELLEFLLHSLGFENTTSVSNEDKNLYNYMNLNMTKALTGVNEDLRVVSQKPILNENSKKNKTLVNFKKITKKNITRINLHNLIAQYDCKLNYYFNLINQHAKKIQEQKRLILNQEQRILNQEYRISNLEKVLGFNIYRKLKDKFKKIVNP